MITLFHPDSRVERVPHAVGADCSAREVKVTGRDGALLRAFPPNCAVRYSEEDPIDRLLEETKKR